ncbi:hypothetical protein N752_05440 [Desulforamulus aquiferis]|nr:MBL fold metallo-hydrolase RNA specificity domain-containing protein [Desulforamulus aquiferis]RYD06338.1 hypothetical protein N752_05440 [Desulforamulus aquiferis]
MKIFGEEVVVNAEIRYIDGFSAHADQAALLDWVKSFNQRLKKVFVVHGEARASANLSRIINEEGIKAYVPGMFEKVELTPTSEQAPEVVVNTWNSISNRMDRIVKGGWCPQGIRL